MTSRWRRRSDDEVPLDRWVVARSLDDALTAFAALHRAGDLGGAQVGDADRERLRASALGCLDDVACLAALLVGAPMWPPMPRQALLDDRTCENDPVAAAVGALAAYSRRLEGIAALFAGREGDAAWTFAGLAVTARARLQALAE